MSRRCGHRPGPACAARAEGRGLRPGLARWDRGSASVWVLAGASLVVLAALAVSIRITAVVARHRAEAAADLAALAAGAGIGVDAGPVQMCRRASRIAELNGATLRSCRVDVAPDGRTGTVEVEVALVVALPGLGDVQVGARARAGRVARAAVPDLDRSNPEPRGIWDD